MVKKSLEQVTAEHIQFGFDPTIIKIAYSNVDGDSSKVMDEIFRLQLQSRSFSTPNANSSSAGNTNQSQEDMISKAIEASITEAKDKKISLEPLNPEQRVRKNGIPVGLKNIGNTCYFNSILQTYFQNAALVRQILQYQIPNRYLNLNEKQLEKRAQDNFEFKRKYASCKLVENLKMMFAYMIGSDRKYIDPTSVLSSIVDDFGNELPVGDQKDIGEFTLIFLSRIDEGLLEANEKPQKMEVENNKVKEHSEGDKNQMNESPSKIAVIGDADELQRPLSLLKNSSVCLSQSSIISREFIGKISNSFHNENVNFHKEEEQLFSLLFVNVKHKELYKALQQVVISNIDDYRNEKGEVVGVEKRTWIKQAPKTLFFQIDRVTFDKEKGTLKKSNEIFDFPEEFYIDPFLDKNKVKALEIQQTVKKLRQEKEKYTGYLQRLELFGQDDSQGENSNSSQNSSSKVNLVNVLKNTYQFLYKQSIKMEIESQSNSNNEDPLFFPKLQSQINEQHLQLIFQYAKQVKDKQFQLKEKVKSIEKEIQRCYELIRTEPYYLYSILIHEGSAEMGHYYSYVHDIEANIWRKYNDINITEQIPEQVFREAKGINATSAYYLVYAQKAVLRPLSSFQPIRNHMVSTAQESGYLKDYYSTFLNEKVKEKIVAENYAMYLEIEQFKMGSFSTRVVDSYVKKFEICNEIFRKNKPQKKRNTPPILINLPTYIKSIDENEYKNALLENCVQEYGPKECSLVFEDLLKKKLSNFNEFKKPKSHQSNEKYMVMFMEDIYHAIAAKELFLSIKQARYNKICSLLNETKSQDHSSYFNWLANLFSNIIVVHLLMSAEEEVEQNPANSVEKLRIMAFILFKFINLQEEKTLYSNCVMWMAELCLMFKEGEYQSQAEKISEMVSEKEYKGEFDEALAKENQNTLNEIKGSIEISEATWNLSRMEDVYVDSMLHARESVKDKIEIANEMYREMKKANLPLTKEEREKVKRKK